MGLEYVKARQLALRRAYPGQFKDLVGEDVNATNMYSLSGSRKIKVARPISVPGSPRERGRSISSAIYMTPGDLGTLQEANNADDYFQLSLNDESYDNEWGSITNKK